MRIHFSHIWRNVSVNASHKICKKPIALECLCFPIRFPYNENSVFPCFWDCMGFYFPQNKGVWNKKETQTFGIFVFSHHFHALHNRSDWPIMRHLLCARVFPNNIRRMFWCRLSGLTPAHTPLKTANIEF